MQRARGGWATVRRVLAVVALLCGVLAMHALSVGHLPWTPHAGEGGRAHHAPAIDVGSPHWQHADTHVAEASAHAPVAASPCDGCGSSTTDGAGGHSAIGLCIAVLTAGVAVLLVAASGRRAILRELHAVPLRWVAAESPVRPPDLSALCVLRT